MTTRTRTPIACECGHTGNLLCKENDQPFSGLWEQYSLEGFDGGSITITSFKDMPDDILAALRPSCPQCSSSKVSYAPH